jgi:hypothetical protein
LSAAGEVRLSAQEPGQCPGVEPIGA